MQDSLILIAIVVYLGLVLLRRLTKKRINLPPGPSAIPILGSVHHLTLQFQEKLFFKWRHTYGDVIYFKLFRTPTVVLNSLESARDLLDKRSVKYSDRPRMVLLAELGGHDTSLPPMRYGDRFRKHRKWMHDFVSNKSALQTYRPVQLQEAHILLRNLLDTPDAFRDHLSRYVTATLLEVTYGRRLTSMEDELVQLAERSVNATNEGGNPGSMLVDFFPICRTIQVKHIPTWMPGAGFKRTALQARTYLDAWRVGGVKMVREAMVSGDVAPCITVSLLEAHQCNPNEDELKDIQDISVNIYGAGTETTFGTITSFVLAMVRNPDVLRKAQAEMDNVLGPDRLPEFCDRDSLPYLGALLEGDHSDYGLASAGRPPDPRDSTNT
ncbi:cytochrome P450 [Earliella scabrosa]|nr:cytochrome P450 [Earliella scabrosa]